MKLGSALGAIGGSLLGGYFAGPIGASAGAAVGGSLFGGTDTGPSALEQFAWNANLQKEFAQNSIQWKVQDAMKAGLHPLAALGASGYSASPIQIDNSSAMLASQNRNDLVKGVQSYAENKLAKERMEQEARIALQRQEAENKRISSESDRNQSEIYANWAQAQQALTMARLMAQTGTYPGMPVSSSDTSLGFGLFHYGQTDYPQVRTYGHATGIRARNWK